jgi:hypothetical protein
MGERHTLAVHTSRMRIQPSVGPEHGPRSHLQAQQQGPTFRLSRNANHARDADAFAPTPGQQSSAGEQSLADRTSQSLTLGFALLFCFEATTFAAP